MILQLEQAAKVKTTDLHLLRAPQSDLRLRLIGLRWFGFQPAASKPSLQLEPDALRFGQPLLQWQDEGLLSLSPREHWLL